MGLAGAAAGLAWLAGRVGPGVIAGRVAAVLVYGLGLVGMLSASALSNAARPGRLKAAPRRLDRRMIFATIAGSYTPFALGALRPGLGVPFCAAVWAPEALGAGLTLAAPGGRERLSFALYLGMGRLVPGVPPPLLAALPSGAWLLLGAAPSTCSARSCTRAAACRSTTPSGGPLVGASGEDAAQQQGGDGQQGARDRGGHGVSPGLAARAASARAEA